jgi:sugar-specific transcriptional regulator TrmB
MEVFSESDENRILSELGLTINQTKVYLALLRLGTASKAISIFKVSGVARQDIYRVLRELQQLGIVEKVITKPTRFRAAEPKKATTILIEKKKENFHELNRKAEEFANKAYERYNPTPNYQEKDQIVLITEKQSIIRKIQESIERTQNTVDSLTPSRELSSWLTSVEESIKIAKDKGVKIRGITKKTSTDKNTTKLIVYSDQPNTKIEDMIPPPKAQFFIFDGKEIILSFEEGNFAEAPVLWTNSPSVIVLQL